MYYTHESHDFLKENSVYTYPDLPVWVPCMVPVLKSVNSSSLRVFAWHPLEGVGILYHRNPYYAFFYLVPPQLTFHPNPPSKVAATNLPYLKSEEKIQ